MGAGQLKASARGGLICALFGSAWMYWAVVFSGHATPIWFSAVSLPAITLTVLGRCEDSGISAPYFFGGGFAALEIVP